MGKNIKKLLIIEIKIWFLKVCFLVPPSLTLPSIQGGRENKDFYKLMLILYI
ncbi:MAG: hypothetical protein LBQ24_05670 [Candidatus Peribacteria bacterium]|nr:hypothetical protein [Candidatus Peribacteria bacterium]